MIGEFKGPYTYSKQVISDWNNNQGGVYFLGVQTSEQKMTVYYVGKAFGTEGIRGRLLQHINDNEWPDITHFGYETCSTEQEALDYEKSEIKRLNPRHNIQHTQKIY